DLRIMALGDSITWGALSTTGNGWRGPLQKLLLQNGGTAGTTVDFIGSLTHGNMADSDTEGHSGAFLADILPHVHPAIEARPNIVTIHAGTNDMDKNRDVWTAIKRLEAIVRAVATGAPDATIFLARIIPANDKAMQPRSDVYNNQITTLSKTLSREGLKIFLVDMSDLLTWHDLSDRKHPNDRGYAKMAQKWNGAIVEASRQGLLTAP
ncbi:carbohydrate esterase family 3 protein, partial [Aulographum hederae CBS 113979]